VYQLAMFEICRLELNEISALLALFFFLEYAGELRIFVLRRRNSPITKHPTPPWTRMGMLNKSFKEKNYYKLKNKRDLTPNSSKAQS